MLKALPFFLSDSLRQKKYRGNPCLVAGHCYVVAEVLFHLFPGRFKPMFLRHEGEPHWVLFDLSRKSWLDPTAEQFKTQPDYSLAKGKGFLTKKPSKRAQVLLMGLKRNNLTNLPEHLTSDKLR